MSVKDWFMLSLCFVALSVLIGFVGQYAVFPLSITLCILSLVSLAISATCVIVAGYAEMLKMDKEEKSERSE